MTHRVCFVVGARPNFMKAAPVFRAVGDDHEDIDLLLVHTGQHYDAEMSAVFLEELELPQPDVFLGVGSGSHAEQTAKALVGIERVLLEHRSSLCVVAGDVNSTLAGALAASKLRIPVAHIEAGLRSFDESMPEEANRRLTDHLSQLLLAHSEGAVENLTKEGIEPSRIHLVGNTMIDSVLRHLPRALEREPWSRFGVEPGEFALVTLHRPALVDNADLLGETVDALEELGDDRPIIFPVHPRTEARLAPGRSAARNHRPDNGLMLCPPLGYLDFLALEAKASFVLTDSGGVQEETSALGVRCFTFRDTTERPVTVELGTNVVLGTSPDRIRDIPQLLEVDRTAEVIPLWDGMASRRAAAVLTEFLG
jgi:UDP-N-acetylglucosamine 2-epimerase (non-hydrolysing)